MRTALIEAPRFVPVEICNGIAETVCPIFRVDAVWARVLDLDGEDGTDFEPVTLASAPDAIEAWWDAAKSGVG